MPQMPRENQGYRLRANLSGSEFAVSGRYYLMFMWNEPSEVTRALGRQGGTAVKNLIAETEKSFPPLL
jgi:hypothetical protein